MKGSGKIILSLAGLTACMVLYVHLQVSLFHLSYSIHDKQIRSDQLSEEYRFMKFEVDRLKAPRRLEKLMHELELDLTLPKAIEVIRLPQPSTYVKAPITQIRDNTLSGHFLTFLERWVGVAQANIES